MFIYRAKFRSFPLHPDYLDETLSTYEKLFVAPNEDDVRKYIDEGKDLDDKIGGGRELLEIEEIGTLSDVIGNFEK